MNSTQHHALYQSDCILTKSSISTFEILTVVSLRSRCIGVCVFDGDDENYDVELSCSARRNLMMMVMMMMVMMMMMMMMMMIMMMMTMIKMMLSWVAMSTVIFLQHCILITATPQCSSQLRNYCALYFNALFTCIGLCMCICICSFFIVTPLCSS